MIKESIQEEDIIIVNIYAPNRGAPQHIRQTLLSRFSCVRLFVTQWTGSSVHGIFQAIVLEWVAISFSNA